MFTDTYFPQISGVSTSISILKDQLKKEGHEVIIFTTTDPNAEAENGVVRLPSVPFASFDDRRVAIAGFDRSLRIARQYKLDIVHTHTEFSLGILGKYVASRLKIPSIHTYHTMYENYTHYIWDGHLIQRSHVRWYSRIFCDQTNGVITPSQLTYDTLMDYGVKVPMRVIPTGVRIPEYGPENRLALRRQLKLKGDDVVLLSLSRLSKEKSIDEIIRSFPTIKAAVPKAQLVIVGDGPHREELEILAQETNALGIQFVGEVDYQDVNAYYQMADVYVNASESESQGLTYLEAIANKLPIITKENNYIRTIINDRAYGQLYPSTELFAETVIHYLQDKAAGKISNINRELLSNISAECFSKSVLEFYLETLSTNHSNQSKYFQRILSAAKDLFIKNIGGAE